MICSLNLKPRYYQIYWLFAFKWYCNINSKEYGIADDPHYLKWNIFINQIIISFEKYFGKYFPISSPSMSILAGLAGRHVTKLFDCSSLPLFYTEVTLWKWHLPSSHSNKEVWVYFSNRFLNLISDVVASCLQMICWRMCWTGWTLSDMRGFTIKYTKMEL